MTPLAPTPNLSGFGVKLAGGEVVLVLGFGDEQVTKTLIFAPEVAGKVGRWLRGRGNFRDTAHIYGDNSYALVEFFPATIHRPYGAGVTLQVWRNGRAVTAEFAASIEWVHEIGEALGYWAQQGSWAPQNS